MPGKLVEGNSTMYGIRATKNQISANKFIHHIPVKHVSNERLDSGRGIDGPNHLALSATLYGGSVASV